MIFVALPASACVLEFLRTLTALQQPEDDEPLPGNAGAAAGSNIARKDTQKVCLDLAPPQSFLPPV